MMRPSDGNDGRLVTKVSDNFTWEQISVPLWTRDIVGGRALRRHAPQRLPFSHPQTIAHTRTSQTQT